MRLLGMNLEQLKYSNNIYVYDNVICNKICNDIMLLFDNSDNIYPGVTSSGKSNIKNNFELFINPDHSDWKIIDEQLYKMFNFYTSEYFNNFSYVNFKYRDVGYFVKNYKQNSGFYKTHVDVSILKNSARILTGILYLNDVEVGGETHFTDINVKIIPKKSRLLLFPPMWMYPHCACTPISSDKYTVNTFFILDQ